MTRKVKEVIRAAGLRDELSFTSFRHGGFTEAGDAGTDAIGEIMAQGRHKSAEGAAPVCEAHACGRSRRARRSGGRRERKPHVCRNERQSFVGTKERLWRKALKRLERVKGIEPSYSAWKAAALPLSYTRAGAAPWVSEHGRS